MIKSILDLDLYKLTMQQAVIKTFPNATVKYKLFNRGNVQFTPYVATFLRQKVNDIRDMALTNDEYVYLLNNCPYFERWYLDFLKGYKFKPNEVNINIIDGNLDVKIEGYWYRTILWETIIMSIISEVHNALTTSIWNVDHITYMNNYIADKGKKFEKMGIKYVDFGTRRRFSYLHHKNVLEILKDNCPTSLLGTSNVHLAMLLGLKPLGTVAHEWFSYHGSHANYHEPNHLAIHNWKKVYGEQLDTALTDTFTSDVFFKEMYTQNCSCYRQDSGDPIEWGHKYLAWYDEIRRKYVDANKSQIKSVMFSDNLTPEKVEKIHKEFNGKFDYTFGIGTNLTHDISGVNPLNIVIKMVEANGKPVIKLSDDVRKETGDVNEIKKAKEILGL